MVYTEEAEVRESIISESQRKDKGVKEKEVDDVFKEGVVIRDE